MQSGQLAKQGACLWRINAQAAMGHDISLDSENASGNHTDLCDKL